MNEEATTCHHDWRWGFAGMPMTAWFGHESAAFLRSARPKLRRCLSCWRTERFNPNAGRWGEWEETFEEGAGTPPHDGATQEFPLEAS